MIESFLAEGLLVLNKFPTKLVKTIVFQSAPDFCQPILQRQIAW